MESRAFYYARVLTFEHKPDRAGYQAIKTTILRKGDTLVIKSPDKLSRNKEDIKRLRSISRQME